MKLRSSLMNDLTWDAILSPAPANSTSGRPVIVLDNEEILTPEDADFGDSVSWRPLTGSGKRYDTQGIPFRTGPLTKDRRGLLSLSPKAPRHEATTNCAASGRLAHEHGLVPYSSAVIGHGELPQP